MENFLRQWQAAALTSIGFFLSRQFVVGENAACCGWKMSLYIPALLLSGLVGVRTYC